MAKARAEIEIAASDAKLNSGLSSASRKLTDFAAHAARTGEKASKSLYTKAPIGKMGSALGNFGGDLLSKGFDALVEGGRSSLDFEKKLVRFAIAAGKTPASMDAIRNSIRQTSQETAVASSEIQEGGAAYIALTGDVEGATASMNAFARIAQASGAKVSDVATATAALKQAMGLDVAKDTEAAFSALIVQGKAGAVEIKDFAGELATLAPQFAQFKNAKGLEGLREMGAAFQIIRQGAGSASEAATQFQALMGELVDAKNVKQLEALGVKVFERNIKTGVVELRNFSDIMEQIAKNKAFNDPRKISEIFGRKESQAAVRTIRGQIDEMGNLKRAGEDTGAVQRDLQTFLESSAGRTEVAFNKMKETIAMAFTPERIEKFVEALTKAAALFVKIVDGIDKTVTAVGKAVEHLTGEGQGDDGARVGWVQGAIEGDDIQNRARRRTLGQWTGLDLEGMTREQRIAALEKATGRNEQETDIIRSAATGLKPGVTEARIAAMKKRMLAGPEEEPSPTSSAGAVASAQTASFERAMRAIGVDLSRSIENAIAKEQVVPTAVLAHEDTAARTRNDEIKKELRQGFDRVVDAVKTSKADVSIGNNDVSKANQAATTPRTRP